MPAEPCTLCGRETAPGSTLFAGRRRGTDRATGSAVIVCAACVADPIARGPRPADSRLGTIELADMFIG